MKIKTSELSGVALDWAVACTQPDESWRVDDWLWDGDRIIGVSGYSPSTDWSQCGPLIEQNDYALPYKSISRCHLGKYEACTPGRFPYNGDTPLIAACRAIVASEFGGYIYVPDELVGNHETG